MCRSSSYDGAQPCDAASRTVKRAERTLDQSETHEFELERLGHIGVDVDLAPARDIGRRGVHLQIPPALKRTVRRRLDQDELRIELERAFRTTAVGLLLG